MTVVGIHQPNFFPWLGYFNKIAKSNKFVFLDNVDFPKTGAGNLVNRVKILNNGNEKWLTMSINKVKSNTMIKDVILLDENKKNYLT